MRVNNNTFESHKNCIKGQVVDLGCGASQYKEDILQLAENYIGVDWENGRHDQSHVDVFANLCETLPFDDAFADTIVSFQVMEHLPEPSIFLSEAYRILKSGGGIFITVPFMWHVHEAPHDYYRYTRYGLEYLFQKAGFANIRVLENTGFWQMWILKFNYYTARLSPGLLRYLWAPFWWLGQRMAQLFDKLDRYPKETASYTVLARKI